MYSNEGISYSDAEYMAERKAEEAKWDAQRYAEDLVNQLRNDLHESFADIRQGLGELSDRVLNLEEGMKDA